MASEQEREITRLSNLKQNKNIPIEKLEQQAKINISVRDFKRTPIFEYDGEDAKMKKMIDKDQSLAEERFRSYLQTCKLESDSDLDTLSSLVFTEVFEKRIQRELNTLHTQGKYPPDKLTKQLTEIQNQKFAIKIKLGIDKTDEENDDLSALELLQKRAFDHIQENKNEFTIGIGTECSKCGYKDWNQYLLWHKVKDFKAMKHPFFIGRWLANYEILKDVKDKKLSKEDAWRYLTCAGQGSDYKIEDKEYCIDYINYCLENWAEITEHLNKN